MVTYQNIRSGKDNKQALYYWRCRVKLYEWRKKHHKLIPAKVRQWGRNGRLRKFGITQADFDRLMEKQKGVCAICKALPSKRWGVLSVDHNHQTGKVRGLLCLTCNTMLGRLERRLKATLTYLDQNAKV